MNTTQLMDIDIPYIIKYCIERSKSKNNYYKPDYCTTIGDTIEEFMETGDYSHEVLREKLEFSETEYKRFLENGTILSARTANTLQRYLGCSAEYWVRLHTYCLINKGNLK